LFLSALSLSCLGHATKVFAKGSLQDFGSSRVMHQALIAAYGFAHNCVYHWHCYWEKSKQEGAGLDFSLVGVQTSCKFA
jgi:hypothetical protein